MPSTSPDILDLMDKWFPETRRGKHCSLDFAAIQFLEARGWTFPKGLCVPPVPSHRGTPYELKCILYLCEEWDFAWKGMWGWDHEAFVKRELEK